MITLDVVDMAKGVMRKEEEECEKGEERGRVGVGDDAGG
jgi:hypothetical protein